jgi:hypothetical protein
MLASHRSLLWDPAMPRSRYFGSAKVKAVPRVNCCLRSHLSDKPWLEDREMSSKKLWISTSWQFKDISGILLNDAKGWKNPVVRCRTAPSEYGCLKAGNVTVCYA